MVICHAVGILDLLMGVEIRGGPMWNDSLMTITLARVHYDAGQALGVWDFGLFCSKAM